MASLPTPWTWRDRERQKPRRTQLTAFDTRKEDHVASEHQKRANRENSRKSTGPKTPQGKQRSSRNAIKYGLTARDNIIFGEEAEAFALYRDEMMETWNPVGAAEGDCVARLIKYGWRLIRCGRIETGIFVNQAAHRSSEQKAARPRYVSRLAYILSGAYEPDGDPNTRDIQPPSEREIEEAPLRELAEIYTGGTGEELRKLDRHETGLHRRYRATLLDLMWLQKDRLG